MSKHLLNKISPTRGEWVHGLVKSGGNELRHRRWGAAQGKQQVQEPRGVKGAVLLLWFPRLRDQAGDVSAEWLK